MKNRIFNFEQFLNENVPGFSYAQADTKSLSDINRVKTGVENQMQRLHDIFRGVFLNNNNTSSSFNYIISDIKIVRIFPNNNCSLDIYLKFKIDEVDYNGVFYNWASINTDIKFQSPAFQQLNGFKLHLENQIKLIGILKKSLLEWFIPKEGEYKTLKEIKVYDILGQIYMIPANKKVIVDEVLTEENQPVINILYKNKMYYLTDTDYYFFNWWFETKEKDSD